MTLLDFQKQYAADILRMFDKPAWEPTLSTENKWLLELLAKSPGRKPFPGQVEYVVAPQFHNFTEAGNKVGIIAARMGTGKTTMSNTIAYLLFNHEYINKGMKTLFLTAGSKHLNKMKREAEAVLGHVADIYIVKLNPSRRKGEITPEEAARMKRKPGRISYFILSKDTGKTTYKIRAMKEGCKCPKCGYRLGGKDKPGKKDVFACTSCGEKTWQAVSGTPSIGETFRKIAGPKVRKLFDFMIVDEVHEMQNPTSLQSLMYQSLVRVTYRTLVMTGTLSNGYASSIFHILYPLIAQHFKRYGGFDYNKIGTFVDFFGSKKETASVKIDSKGSRRRSVKVEELPQINDRIISFLAPYTTWFSMEDLNVEMPEFHEYINFVDMDPEITDRMREWSERVYAAANLVKDYNTMHFKASLHYRVNNPTHDYIQVVKGERVFEQYDENSDVDATEPQEVEYEIPYNPLPASFRSNKEKNLLTTVKKELEEGRRVMVYGVYNQSTNLYGRLMDLFEEEGIDAGFLPDNVKSEDIEDWIINFEGDVLILPQKRVATGLDLVMFHTVIFYEMDRQLRVVQQAKVRPWRPVGQEKEVRVYYIAYRGQQEKELKSMAQKMRAAATVEGEIVDGDSIAAIYDYNPELTAAIAEITNTIESGEVESDMIRLGRDHSPFEELYLELLDQHAEEEESEEISEDEDDEGENNKGGDSGSNGGNIIVEEIEIEVEIAVAVEPSADAFIPAPEEQVAAATAPEKPIIEERPVIVPVEQSYTDLIDNSGGQGSFIF